MRSPRASLAQDVKRPWASARRRIKTPHEHLDAVGGADMTSLSSKILNWGFRRYVRRFVRKNFNAVRVVGQNRLPDRSAAPIVCFINHPGWWDPMTGVLMTDLLFPGRSFTAPMDAEALRNYPILERLGFFAVQRESASGARDFLRTSRNLLKQPQTILWLTPAGKFHDVRQPASFMTGLSHLVDAEFPGTVLPMAIEYTFWNERAPELLVQFGSPVDCRTLPADRDARTKAFEAALATTQSSLAELAIARDPENFATLALGRAGIGGLYDCWRRIAAGLRGRRFQDRHGNEPMPSATSVRGELT
jgi:1-acyl-sn-glycerol-3-phosphate acyltransferase